MPEIFWNKYQKIKEIANKNSNIKTYLAKIEPLVKEIKPENEKDYYLISQRLEKLKKEIKIYDIIEENGIFYVVIDNNEELSNKVDEWLLSDYLDIQKEGVVIGHGTPIKKNEIMELFQLEKAMCKIESLSKENKKQIGSGFFCELNDFPIKYALFTNNHILDESDIEIGNTIKIECLERSFLVLYNPNKKEIKITKERRVYTNKELDCTCIEILESDGIKDFFKIDSKIFKYNNNTLKNNDIFILQFPKGNDISFSFGKIIALKDDKIIHNASTEGGSSGSPIIRRFDDNYVIGIHCGGKKNNDTYIYNVATNFISVLNHLKNQMNEINCIFESKEFFEEIELLHNFNENIENWNSSDQTDYLEAKNYHKNFLEENIEIYVDGVKIEFNYKYKVKISTEIKVKYKFKQEMKNTSYMFYKCPNLKSMDLSSFNMTNIKKMNYMFGYCTSLKSVNIYSKNLSNLNSMIGLFYNSSSLESIKISSFNSSNLKDMSEMFYGCSSLKLIEFSSINTSNVINMNNMFYDCQGLKSLNLSSFNTGKVKDMSNMFHNCKSLESIDLSSFNTRNVNKMNKMFYKCSSLQSIDLSAFNTSDVIDMSYMFSCCDNLKSLSLSSFNTNNVQNMCCMFLRCKSLESLDLSLFNSNNAKEINSMFHECSSLVKDNIKINNKEDKIFKDFEKLKILDLKCSIY